MSHSKEIFPKNKKGDLHGYCEFYWENGKLVRKGVYVNGFWYGYFVAYYPDGGVLEDSTGYFLDDHKVSDSNEAGYCFIWCKVIV